MAAQKKKDRRFPQAEFEIPLADALDALLDNNDVEDGDAWHFHVNGDVLIITRIRAPIDAPGNGQGQGQGNGP